MYRCYNKLSTFAHDYYFCTMWLNRFYYVAFITAIILLASCKDEKDKQSVSTEDKNAPKTIPPYVTEIQKKVSQYPDSASLRLQYVYALDSISEFSTAITQLDTLLKKDSTNYGLWYAKGQVAEDAKDTTSAIESYIRATRIYPSPDAQLALANLYAEQKNNKALLICGRVKELGLGREYDANSSFIAGVYYARTGNKEQAIKLFDDCIANDYTHMPAYIEKGMVYFDNKQYDEALKVFQFASTVNTLYADCYYYIARCYEMTGKKDSAIMKFQQALRLDKNSEETRAALKRLGAE